MKIIRYMIIVQMELRFHLQKRCLYTFIFFVLRVNKKTGVQFQVKISYWTCAVDSLIVTVQ